MARGSITRQPSKTGRHDKVASGFRGQVRTAERAAIAAGKGTKAGRAAGSIRAAAAKAKSAVIEKKAPGATAKKAAKAAGGAAPKGYNPLAPERIQEILNRLDERYPNVTCALHHKSAWELLVATVLSAQCTDVRVNMVTPILFEKYPTPQDLAALEPEQLEPDIKSTGFFRNKSKSIVGAARKLISDFGGTVPHTMDELLTLPGVARKTANVVLGTWFKQADGVVVDTHVQRISRRLELTRNEEPQKIEQDLMQVIPRDHWIDFSHQIIHHGRALCIARKPKCVDCPLENLCHAADKTWSTVDIHKPAKP